MSAVAAVLLAAGFGTRLGALSADCPKPLLDVGGAPIATHLVRRLSAVEGLATIVVVINDTHPDLFDAWRTRLRSPPDVQLVNTGATRADERRGAVRDMQAAMRTLPRHDGRWLVVGGDNLVAQSDLVALDHWGRNVGDTVLCRDVGLHPSGSFGEVTLDTGGLIVGFREKPDRRESPIAATCTYSLGAATPALLAAYLSEGGDHDAPGRFIEWLAQRAAVHACMLGGDYHDIGTPENLDAARRALAGGG